ncbi:hypothetical protein D3C87_263860 [compost metagenome]
MKNIGLIILICLYGCFSSCGFVTNEEVIGKYHLIAVDAHEDLCLGYEVPDENYICIVPSKILAYSKNEKYIFLKQTPYLNKDTLDINYYIVPILEDRIVIFPEDHIMGPLKEQNFNEEISKMNIGNLKFNSLD